MKEFLVTSAWNGRAKHILDAIYSWNRALKTADRQVKYCRMASSPLVFFRGTNHLFWADFAGDARLTRFSNDQTNTWLQGDLHAYNFGSYGNDEGEVVYDLNDFDDALIADYQFDLWRMAVSMVLVARQSGFLSKREQERGVIEFVTAYLDGLKALRKGQPPYFTQDNTDGKLDNFLREVKKTYSRAGMLKRWATRQDGSRGFDLTRSKLEAVSAEAQEMIVAGLSDYRSTLTSELAERPHHFRVIDVAKRLLAGTGSLGRPRYYLLIAGDSEENENEERILDIKLQQKPTGYAFLSPQAQSRHDTTFDNEAQRHALAYWSLTRHTDDYLGWIRLGDHAYSVRERSPFKEAFPGEALDTRGAFNKLARQWGAVLAANHVRANKGLAKAVTNLVKGRRKAFKALVSDVAFNYAGQVNDDWRLFVAALGLKAGECDEHTFRLPTYEKGSLLPG